MKDEVFAYALFGSKPMSTIGFDKTTPIEFQEQQPHPLFDLEEWWLIWQKYEHLFPMQNYVLFAQHNGSWFEVYFVNRTTCLNAINSNLDHFQDKLGEKLTAEEIFQRLISSGNVFSNALNKSQALYGLLLGYGRENAKGFDDYYVNNQKQKGPKLTSLQHKEGELMIPPFASFSKNETKKIQKQYKKDRRVIQKNFSEGDFLEIVLNQLTS